MYSSFVVSGTNLYAGSLGGVYLSTNNGTNWTQVTSGLVMNVHCLAVSGTNLFAGTNGGGVFLSTNNGTSWIQDSSNLSKTTVNSIIVNGTNLCAGTNSGIFLSTNNGTNWTQVYTDPTDINVNCLAICGMNLFAGTWWGGVYLSSNNGSSWAQVNTGLTNIDVHAIAVSGTNLFAGTWGGGVFHSTDHGTSWTSINTGLLSNTDVNTLTVSGTNLFAGTDAGVFEYPNYIKLAPTIVSVKDVPNDNGKQVWVRWSVPAPPASNNITSFGVWRNDSVWTYVMETKTTNDTIYQVVAPTLFDSTKSKGQYLTPFKVTAHTPDPSLFYTSNPMSGYSLDNLPPLAPTAVLGTTIAGVYRISWKPAINQFNDFKNYVLYRSEYASVGISASIKLADVFDTVYNDKTVQVGKRYYYNVTSIDYSGNESMPASLIANITSVENEDGVIPTVFGLDQNYPNPFNPSTTIQYGLPTLSTVRLIIYDMLGQVVCELINSEQQARYQSVVWNANVASGLYFYRIEATSIDDPNKRFVETKKMLLLK